MNPICSLRESWSIQQLLELTCLWECRFTTLEPAPEPLLRFYSVATCFAIGFNDSQKSMPFLKPWLDVVESVLTHSTNCGFSSWLLTSPFCASPRRALRSRREAHHVATIEIVGDSFSLTVSRADRLTHSNCETEFVIISLLSRSKDA